jgi:hypothetical protein
VVVFVAVVCIPLALIICILAKRQKDMSINEEEDHPPPSIRVGQKVLYDTKAGYECNLIVTKVNKEKSEVRGYFAIDSPKDAEILVLHFDSDNHQIIFSFRTLDGDAGELIFNIKGVVELRGYYVYIECLSTVTKIVNPS